MRATEPSKTQRFDGSTARLRFVPARAESTSSSLLAISSPYFGGRTLRLIQVTDIERFRTELSTGIPDSIKQALNARVLAARPGHAEARAKQRTKQAKISTRSINKALTVLSMVFNYAMRNQWVARNPAEYVDHLEMIARSSSGPWIWMS